MEYPYMALAISVGAIAGLILGIAILLRYERRDL